MRWKDLDTSPGGWPAQGTLECSSPAGASHVICCPGTLRTLPLMPLLLQQAPLPSDFQLGSVNKGYEETVKVAQSCPTLCNPMDIQSMEFSRPEYWSG